MRQSREKRRRQTIHALRLAENVTRYQKKISARNRKSWNARGEANRLDRPEWSAKE
jgi:hypothetical protein